MSINGLTTDFYLRKSRKDIEEERKASNQGENYDTLSRHRTQLLAYAKKHQLQIQMIHEEVVSGESISERPEIQKLVRRIETGEIEAVLVVDMDRLGRGDMLDQGILDRAFRYSGTKLLTLTDTYDPEDESWELVFGVKSLIARQELKAITRRLQGGRRSSVSEGKSISKKPAYGYLRNENLRLYPDPEKAWVVKKIFEMVSNGQGRQAVANELDKLGISPPDPKKTNWSPSTITAIVKNEVYLGHIIWGKFKYSKRGGEYTKIKTSREEWNVAENAHEALVSEELFEAANRASSGRYRPSTIVSKTLSNPLAGILKCEVCGYTMWLQIRKDRPTASVRCAHPSCKGVQKGASFKLVEKALLEALEDHVKEHEYTGRIESTDKVDVQFKEKAVALKQKEKEELDTQMNSLHDLLEKGIYSIDKFIDRQKNISERLEKVESEIRNLETEIEKEQLKNKNLHEYIPAVKKVLEAYHHTDNIEKKNRLLKSILEKVTFLRKKDWVKQDQFEIRLYPKI